MFEFIMDIRQISFYSVNIRTVALTRTYYISLSNATGIKSMVVLSRNHHNQDLMVNYDLSKWFVCIQISFYFIFLDSENDGGHHTLLLLANEPEETGEDDADVNIINRPTLRSDEFDYCDRVNAVKYVSIWNPVPLLDINGKQVFY